MDLATKMRPKSFDEYMGVGIRNSLRKRLSNPDDLPHSYLFYGTRGCGKTTAARLLAKEYMCENRVDGHACGKCAACLELDETLINNVAGQEVVGVTELDITSESGKEAIENALNNAIEEPMWPLKYKILILDECHMATKQAQNRLLKITEEPPKHLVLIFCTTDPDKMLETLKDRIQVKVRVKKADMEELVARLMKGCELENMRTSKEALVAIARNCDRNPRQCWKMIDEIASQYDKEINLQNVASYLGGVDDNVYFKYIEAAQKGMEESLNFIYNELTTKGIEYDAFLGELTKFVLNCIEVRFGIATESLPTSFVELASKLFKSYNPQDLDTMLQIIENANAKVAQSKGDTEQLKLEILMVALRIGKLKELSTGLANEFVRAMKENYAGMDEHSRKQREEAQKKTAVMKEVTPDLMQSIFGKTLVEVKPGNKENLLPEITDDEDDSEWTDDALMALIKN